LVNRSRRRHRHRIDASLRHELIVEHRVVRQHDDRSVAHARGAPPVFVEMTSAAAASSTASCAAACRTVPLCQRPGGRRRLRVDSTARPCMSGISSAASAISAMARTASTGYSPTPVRPQGVTPWHDPLAAPGVRKRRRGPRSAPALNGCFAARAAASSPAHAGGKTALASWMGQCPWPGIAVACTETKVLGGPALLSPTRRCDSTAPRGARLQMTELSGPAFAARASTRSRA
jgi:hypothetical protein